MTISPCRVPIAQGDEDRQDRKAREREAGEGCPGFEQGHRSDPGQRDQGSPITLRRAVVFLCSSWASLLALVVFPPFSTLETRMVCVGSRLKIFGQVLQQLSRRGEGEDS